MVDDDPLVLTGFKRVLNNYCLVDITDSAEEALELIREKGPYAVLVVDYMMPVMTGLELAVKALPLNPRTQRIMLTGKGSLEMATMAINRGLFSYFLNKPVTPEILLDTVLISFERYRKGYSFLPPAAAEISGLRLFNRGQRLSAEKSYTAAVTEIEAARASFRESGSGELLARANLFLAHNVIRAASEGDLEPDSPAINELLVETLLLVKKHGRDILAPGEWRCLKPPMSMFMKSSKDANFFYPVSNLGKIKTLGPLEITRERKKLVPGEALNPKAILLLAFLLTHAPHQVAKEAVFVHFWPELDLEAARNNCSSLFYLINGFLGKGTIVSRKDYCRVELSAYELDKIRFEDLVREGDILMDGGDLFRALERYEQATGIYRGDYLANYASIDWLDAERQRLRKIYAGMCKNMAGIFSGAGDNAASVRLLEKIPLEAYDDEIAQQVISAYLKIGGKGKAKEIFYAYRHLLRQKYGLEPHLAIEKLLL